MQKLRWGVLSSAKIARTKVIPAIQASDQGELVAIASRTSSNAEQLALELGIPKAYGSYEALLADATIDAIYNPLPNHLHIPWTLKALAAGKHVLCEKPLGLDAAEVRHLIQVAQQHPQLKVMEAFMYRFHPQWQCAKQQVQAGAIGQVRSIHAHFSYNNRAPDNIRNFALWGGGALLDIGCYCISLARFLYDHEPVRVLGQITAFAGYEVDCLASGIMEFADGNATFSVSTKSEADQYVKIYGEQGSLSLGLPFNPSSSHSTELLLRRHGQEQRLVQAPCDQYRAMVDGFALSILQRTPVPTPLSDALANMTIIDALFASAKTARWLDIA